MTDNQPKKENVKNRHLINEVYPNASTLFSMKSVSASDLVSSGTIILDTNALLAPYSLQTEQLDDIEKVLKPLVESKRLIIPGQVAREFAKQRSEKLKQIHEHITKARSTPVSSIPDSPLLRAHDEYKTLELADKELKAAEKKRHEMLDKLLGIVRSWTWNDPVSELYRKIGLDQVLLEPTMTCDEILSDLDRRYSMLMPPGYKDKNKDENYAGDLFIWHTVLRAAEENKTDILFVSGDQKNDWWHQSSGRPLYPRFELLYEFSTRSGGKCIQITSYSDFLSIAGASKQVVESVANAELAENISLPQVKDESEIQGQVDGQVVKGVPQKALSSESNLDEDPELNESPKNDKSKGSYGSNS